MKYTNEDLNMKELFEQAQFNIISSLCENKIKRCLKRTLNKFKSNSNYDIMVDCFVYSMCNVSYDNIYDISGVVELFDINVDYLMQNELLSDVFNNAQKKYFKMKGVALNGECRVQ